MVWPAGSSLGAGASAALVLMLIVQPSSSSSVLRHSPLTSAAGGLERVRRSKALRCFVLIFSSKQYVKALQGE
jgi:hypothetical protein